MRARRRQDAARVRAKVARIAVFWHGEDALSQRQLGKLASTHARPCSCWLCRGHKDVPPRGERGG